VSRSLARGGSPVKAVRRQVRQAAWLIGVSLAATTALYPVLVEHWLGGDRVLFVELMVGLCASLASFQVRGMLAGREDFLSYAASMVVEGIVRLVPGVVLLAVGCRTVGWYGLLFALAPAGAAVTGLVLPRLLGRPALGHGIVGGSEEIPDDEGSRRAAANLALLTGATLASQLLLNAVPLMVGVRYQHATGSPAREAAAIASAVGLTRLGILVLLPMQAPLLPRLTAAATRGDMRELRQRTLWLVGVCVAAGGVMLLATGTIGPWVLRYIMHALADLPAWFLVVLSLGTLFTMLGYVLQSALIALSRHASVLIGWGLGVATTVPLLTALGNSLHVIALAAVVGPAVTAVFLAVDCWWSSRASALQAAAPSSASAAEAEAPVS
jgi:O-antigen/teichoic acid export membrane protein